MNRLIAILAGTLALIFAGDAIAQKKTPKKINHKVNAGSFKAQLTGTANDDSTASVKVN